MCASIVTAILKPYKGNGVVVVNGDNYINAVQSVFANITKFNRISTDPTLVRLSTIQRFILIYYV